MRIFAACSSSSHPETGAYFGIVLVGQACWRSTAAFACSSPQASATLHSSRKSNHLFECAIVCRGNSCFCSAYGFSGRIVRILLDQVVQECINNEESPISFRERMQHSVEHRIHLSHAVNITDMASPLQSSNPLPDRVSLQAARLPQRAGIAERIEERMVREQHLPSPYAKRFDILCRSSGRSVSSEIGLCGLRQ
jgi:hypothetical protein